MLGWVINLGGGRDAGRAFTSHTAWYDFVRIYLTPYDLISQPSFFLSSPSPAQPIPLPSTQGVRLRAQTVSDLLVITTSPLVAG